VVTSTQVRPEDLVRAKIDEQLAALTGHEQVARAGVDPEGVHQMRVAVRRLRAAVKVSHLAAAEQLQAELKWLGSALGAVRDLDVQLEHLRGLAADFEPDEQAAVERLLGGLRLDRRRARQRMLGALRSRRYAALLESLSAVTHAEPARNSDVPVKKKQWAASLAELIKRPYRKLIKDAHALGSDPPDDDLHALRIRGKRLRYAAELAAPVGGKPVRKLIQATKSLQDVLGDHQDAVVAEQELRRLLREQNGPVETDVVFVAGRLVERERARRAECRARWRAALAEVDSQATKVITT
jgi:CHAD domain-containing protein